MEHAISRITNFAGGTAKDLDALRAIFEEATVIVERDLPGTLVYEIFGNKKTFRFVARGDYVDGAAFQKHAERLMETGVLARMAELADFDLNISLGDVDDDVRDLLEGLGFETYTPLASAKP